MAERTLHWQTLARLTAGQDMWSTHPLPDIGLRSVRLADGPMGITGGRVDERDLALLSPCGLALAASWDSALVRRVGQVIGDEALRVGVQGVLAPNLNLVRSPLAGRAFELFGEDPLLISRLGSAWAMGVQSRGVASVVKHLVCNDSETDRRSMNVQIDEVTLREVYFRPFEQTAREGAWGMLTAYNRVNGVTCAEHAQAIGWLKDELRWDGLVMSDWFGTHDGVASLNAGLDLEMPGPARFMGPALATAVEEGRLDGARLEQAGERLQRLAARVSDAPRYEPQREPERLAVLEEAAAAGMVLLHNDGGILPLVEHDLGVGATHGREWAAEQPQVVALIGPNAIQPCFQGGTFAKVALDPTVETPLAAIAKRFPDVEFAEGVRAEHRIPPLPMPEGCQVSFQDAGGHELHRETRHASSLVWFKDMPGVGDLLALQGEAVVSVSLDYTAQRSGLHTLYLGGTGRVSLLIDGIEQARFDGVALAGDIMGKLMQSPHDTFAVELEAGQTVALQWRMAIGKSIAHGLWLGCEPPAQPDLLDQAVALARRADTVVLVVGETADAGLESVDRDTTQLSLAQQDLVRAVCAANPRTVVVLNVAHPVDTACLADAAAVLLAWYPGQGFGAALAAVLAGDREPGGRLPVTFAAREADYPVWSLAPDAQGSLPYREGWWVGYRHFVAHGIAPAYGLGHGLGYARFEPGMPSLQGDTVERLQVSVPLRNTSARAGKVVPQLYLQGPSRAGEPVRLALEGFDALHVPAQDEATGQLALERRAFCRWDSREQAWQLVSGCYRMVLGASVTEPWFSLDLDVDAEGRIHAGGWHISRIDRGRAR